jgi:acetyl esterase/lipase
VREKLPPTLVLHGTGDKTVPFAQATAFAKAMEAAGNRCEVFAAEGQGHGWFNYNRGDGKAFVETVRAADGFLVSLGYLKGEATVE